MLEPLRFFTSPVLPTVYDDSLSYLEAVYKVSDKLNEVIASQNALADSVDAKIKAQVDALAKKWESEIKGLISAFKTEITNQINTNQKWVETQILKLTTFVNSQVGVLYELIASNNSKIKIWVAVELKKLADSLEKITDVYVISPVDGQLKPIQLALDEMWYYLRYLSITAIEYDLLRLTAEEYDAFSLSAFEYDLYAKYYLNMAKWKDKQLIYNEFTGMKDSVGNVIQMIISVLRVDGLTAEYYDDARLEASRYDGLRLSAFDYGWKATQTIIPII